MAGMQKQITINAPAAKVFGYLADFPKHSEWAQHKLRIQQTSQGAVGVGATFSCVGHQMGKDNADQVTVTEFVPNERIGFEALGGGGHFRHAFVLEPEGQGTRLSKRFDTVKLSLMTTLMMPLLMLMGPRLLEKDLQRIKAKLEV